MALNAPSFIPQPWATSGQAATIPDQKPEFGRASWSQGFPTETSIPLNAGGIPPNYLDFQGVLKILSQFAFFQQSGGLFTWSSSLDYLKGCHILGSDGEEYVALASSGPSVSAGAKNPVDPSSSAYWKLANANDDSGSVLIGTVVAFSGTFGGTGNRFPIPLGGTSPDTNWVLCDGTRTNGLAVPDIRDRMILGAGSEHSVGSTGGSETHEHGFSGTVGATTLTESQLASHNHAYIGSQGLYPSADGIISGGTGNVGTGYVQNSGGSQSHTHSLSNISSGSASSLSPYYTLAFIMRIA